MDVEKVLYIVLGPVINKYFSYVSEKTAFNIQYKDNQEYFDTMAVCKNKILILEVVYALRK